jgi:hypothetical protein
VSAGRVGIYSEVGKFATRSRQESLVGMASRTRGGMCGSRLRSTSDLNSGLIYLAVTSRGKYGQISS